MDVWAKALETRNLKINIEKTKVMAIGKTDEVMRIKLKGEEIEQVDTFKYLGVKIQKTGTMEAELNDRLEAATKLYYSLNNAFIRKKEVSRKTKIIVYKTIFKSVLLYGSESWTLSKRMASKVQAIEMKFLRGVKGITKRDKIRNSKIREDLEVKPIQDDIHRRQLRWFGHLIRMGEERTVKKIWQSRTQLRRPRGRPKKTWDAQIDELLKGKGLTWNEAKKVARNKKEWAQTIYKP